MSRSGRGDAKRTIARNGHRRRLIDSAMSRPARERGTLFAPPAIEVERRADGTLLLRSPVPLQPYPARIGEWLETWGEREPDRAFLFERGADGQWHGVTYGEAAQRVQRLAAGLLQRNLSAERPLAILSDNGVEHALLMLAALVEILHGEAPDPQVIRL